MSSWASIAAPATKPSTTPSTIVTAAHSPTTEGLGLTSTPRAFAFAATASASASGGGAFSWAAKVTGKNSGEHNPSPTGVADIDALSAMASPAFSSASKLTRAAELKQISLDLESSRAGLNLAFKQAVTTAAPSAATTNAKSEDSKFKAAEASPAVDATNGMPVQPVQPLTEAKIAKRQRQIDIGKATVGYKNYIHHVSKKAREFKNPRHPNTPKKTAKISKRNFQGLIAAWRKQLHKWDDTGPFLKEPSTSAANINVAEEDAVLVASTAVKEEAARVRRASSWADMADSDSDEDEDDDSMLSGSSKSKAVSSIDTTRTKRKAENELLPARHEKREKVNTEESAVAVKPVSRALQLARQRAAAKKAASN